MTMNFEFKCPQCGNAVAVDESYRGQVVECPHCAKGIVVPRNKTSGQAVQRPESKVVSIQCPHCGTEYEATQQDMHRLVSCEICGKNFVAGTTSRKQSVGVAQPRPTTQTGSQRSAASRPNQSSHSHGEKPRVGNPHVGIGEGDVVSAATQGRGALLHKFLWKPLLSFKWLWPCLLVIGFTVKVHNQNHRARGDRRARPSAICPICWCNKPSGNGDTGMSVSQENQEASDDNDQSIASRIVQKRLREIEENQRQEKITEAKRQRNIEMGRSETAGFTAADYAAYSGGGRGGWAWREKKENRTSGASRSFLDDLDYAFETSTGFSSDTRTDQEKQEDAILRDVLEATKNRHQKNLQRIKCTGYDYSMSEDSADLVILDSRGQVCHIIYDGNSSSLTDYPHFIPQTVALQLIQDRSSIAILEMVIDPVPLTPRQPPIPTAEEAAHPELFKQRLKKLGL